MIFFEKDGTLFDEFAVPATLGVDYLIDGKVVPSGTYRGSGTVTVTAAAWPD